MSYPFDELNDGYAWGGFQLGGELGPGNILGSQVPGLPEQVLPGADGSQDMSAMSGQVGLQQDRDNLYNSDGMPFFVGEDQEHSAEAGGMESMDQLTMPKPMIRQLEQEQMWLYPRPFYEEVFSDGANEYPDASQQSDSSHSTNE